MPAIEVTRQARNELRDLIETRHLPDDTRERVSRSLLTLEEFPRAGNHDARTSDAAIALA